MSEFGGLWKHEKTPACTKKKKKLSWRFTPYGWPVVTVLMYSVWVNACDPLWVCVSFQFFIIIIINTHWAWRLYQEVINTAEPGVLLSKINDTWNLHKTKDGVTYTCLIDEVNWFHHTGLFWAERWTWQRWKDLGTWSTRRLPLSVARPWGRWRGTWVTSTPSGGVGFSR